MAELLNDEGVDFVLTPEVPLPDAGPQLAWSSVGVPALWHHLSKTVPQLTKFLKAHNVDIVHTNDGRIHAMWAAATRAAGAKQLWHHRADPTAFGVNFLAPLTARHIVTVSRFARPQRPILPIGRKWSVVHSPFEHPKVSPDRTQARAELLQEIGCAEDTRTIGYFGALIDRKRPVAFVDAVHAFIRSHPEIPIAGLIFGREPPGGQPLEDAVRKRALELSIEDRIHLMGFRYPVEPCICGTDILLVPAVNEPFGRTLIEAMMLGTPVVATDHGGNPEAIEPGVNGCLVEPETPAAFVSPMYQLLGDDADWQRMSDTARTQALSSYGLEKHVGQIANIYEQMSNRPREGRKSAQPG